MCSSTL